MPELKPLGNTVKVSASVPEKIASIMQTRHGCRDLEDDGNQSRFCDRAFRRNIIKKMTGEQAWSLALGVDTIADLPTVKLTVEVPVVVSKNLANHCRRHAYDFQTILSEAVMKHTMSCILPDSLFVNLYNQLMQESSHDGGLLEGVSHKPQDLEASR